MKTQLKVSVFVAACICLTSVSIGWANSITFQGTSQANDVPLIRAGGGGANANYGGSLLLDVGGYGGGVRESLLRFNVSSLAGQTVLAHLLNLTVATGGSGVFGTYSNQAVNLYVVSAANASWIEGTGGGTGTVQNGVATWPDLSYSATTPTAWAGGPLAQCRRLHRHTSWFCERRQLDDGRSSHRYLYQSRLLAKLDRQSLTKWRLLVVLPESRISEWLGPLRLEPASLRGSTGTNRDRNARARNIRIARSVRYWSAAGESPARPLNWLEVGQQSPRSNPLWQHYFSAGLSVESFAPV